MYATCMVNRSRTEIHLGLKIHVKYCIFKTLYRWTARLTSGVFSNAMRDALSIIYILSSFVCFFKQLLVVSTIECSQTYLGYKMWERHKELPDQVRHHHQHVEFVICGGFRVEIGAGFTVPCNICVLIHRTDSIRFFSMGITKFVKISAQYRAN